MTIFGLSVRGGSTERGLEWSERKNCVFETGNNSFFLFFWFNVAISQNLLFVFFLHKAVLAVLAVSWFQREILHCMNVGDETAITLLNLPNEEHYSPIAPLYRTELNPPKIVEDKVSKQLPCTIKTAHASTSGFFLLLTTVQVYNTPRKGLCSGSLWLAFKSTQAETAKEVWRKFFFCCSVSDIQS